MQSIHASKQLFEILSVRSFLWGNNAADKQAQIKRWCSQQFILASLPALKSRPNPLHWDLTKYNRILTRLFSFRRRWFFCEKKVPWRIPNHGCFFREISRYLPCLKLEVVGFYIFLVCLTFMRKNYIWNMKLTWKTRQTDRTLSCQPWQ